MASINSQYSLLQVINIISFDVPYPPNYGGVIDVFYKIKALHEQGCEIILHCFNYGRGEQKTLEKYCKKVHYYPRHNNLLKLAGTLPYIVSTRNDKELLNNLLQNKHPILFEGLHSCYFLNDAALRDRFKIVRTHNIEHDYYFNLSKSEKRIFQKIYFYWEANRLLKFESQLINANIIAAISANDAYHFRRKYNNVETLFAFHPFEKVIDNTGFGTFVLYHGNLAVAENNVAALYLVKNVFASLNIPFYIAGSNPSNELIMAIKQYPHIKIFANVETEEINNLVQQAHINMLPTFQATGIKLKLLAALYSGKHCLVNTPMVANTGLEELCLIKDKPTEMQQAIIDLMQQPFTSESQAKRKQILDQQFSVEFGAIKLLNLLPKL